MRNMKGRKWLSLLLALALCMGLASTAALAKGDADDEENDDASGVKSGDTSSVAIKVGDYTVCFAYENSGALWVYDGAAGLGWDTNEEADDDYGEGATLLLTAAVKKQSATDVYYEKADADKASLTVDRLYLTYVSGDRRAFSLSEDGYVTELTTNDIDADSVKLYCCKREEAAVLLCADVKVTINGSAEDVTVRVYVSQTAPVTSVEVTRPDSDTVADLNACLAAMAEDEEAAGLGIVVTLGNCTYEGTVVVPGELELEDQDMTLTLKGGKKTVLKGGIDLNGTGALVRGIRFEGAGKTSETNNTALYNGPATVIDCTFTGYDIAVDMSDGVIVCEENDLFYDNATAVRIDLNGEDGNMAVWGYNAFLNNDTAIQIESMGTKFTPYYLRIQDSSFIGNTTDLDVSCPGTFYFYRNYYGETIKALLEAVESYGEFSDELEEIVKTIRKAGGNKLPTYREPQLTYDSTRTTIVTNPRWILPVVKGGWNLLISDWRLLTRILNGEADDLRIDSSAFATGDTETAQVIEVTKVSGGEETQVGCWSFGGQKQK